MTTQSSLRERAKPVGVAKVEARHVPYAVAKRCFDIVSSFIALLVLFPVFLVIAALVRLTSKGPAFYRCERIGLCGVPFAFVKFRSMYVDADDRLKDILHANEKDGPIFKIRNDPRVTPVGRFIRKYSLDELPQLISVLIGDMSMVGPRPPLPREVSQYDEYCMMRLSVKPGITCFWQVMGRSNLTFEEWMDLDHRYLQEMSFLTDLKLLCLTPMAVLKGRGAF